MKKAIVLLLALTVIGGAVFAQVTVSGYDKVSLNFNETGAMITDGIRININGADADGVYGFKTRFEGSANAYAPKLVPDFTGDGTADALAKNDFGVTYAYAYGKFFDGMLKLTAGKLDIYDYQYSAGANNQVLGNTANDGFGGLGYASRPAAFLAQVFPVEGLNVGVAYMPGRLPNGAFEYNTFNLTKLYYGVKYDTDMFGILYEGNWKGNDFDMIRHSLSFNYTGVENLMATVGYKGAYGATDWTHGAYALLGYTMDKLYVEFDVDAVIAPDVKLYLEGAVEYDVGLAKLRGFFAYDDEVGNLTYSKVTYEDSVNEFQVGAEASVPFGNAGLTEFNVGFNYADDYGWKIPMFFRVAF